MVVDLCLGASLPLARLPLGPRRSGRSRLPPGCGRSLHRGLHRGRSARPLHRPGGALVLRRARHAASRRAARLGSRAPGRSSGARTRAGGATRAAARAATSLATASHAAAAAAARAPGGGGGRGVGGGGGRRVECGERALRRGGGALHGGDGFVPSRRLVDCLGGKAVSKHLSLTTQVYSKYVSK